MKKHCSEKNAKEGSDRHKEVWSAYACTNCWSSQQEGDETFLTKHRSCAEQKKANSKSVINWVKELSGKVDEIDIDLQLSDLSDSEDEEEEENITSETEAAVANILPKPTSAATPTSTSAPLPGPVTISAPQLSTNTTSQPNTTPQPNTTKSTKIHQQSPHKHYKGVKEQGRRWARHTEVQAISQKAAASVLTDKYNALRIRFEEVSNEKKELERKDRKLRQVTEECEELRVSLNKTKKALDLAQSEVAKTQLRAKYSSEEVAVLQEQLTEERRRRRELEVQNEQARKKVLRAELHIPVRRNEIPSDILIYTDEDEDRECYADDARGVRCHHLNILVEGGQLTVRKHRIRKRFVPEDDEIVEPSATRFNYTN